MPVTGTRRIQIKFVLGTVNVRPQIFQLAASGVRSVAWPLNPRSPWTSMERVGSTWTALKASRKQHHPNVWLVSRSITQKIYRKRNFTARLAEKHSQQRQAWKGIKILQSTRKQYKLLKLALPNSLPLQFSSRTPFLAVFAFHSFRLCHSNTISHKLGQILIILYRSR